MNLIPNPAIQPLAVLWNWTIPRFPEVSAIWVGSTNDVWPFPATIVFCVPSWFPLSSQIVAVMFADEVERFASATPIVKPAVLSKGKVIVDGNWV
jgi:hypothetical protein